MRSEFTNWLVYSKYCHDLTGVPPSCFSLTNANGLWEYSPFLCGVGLAEALAETYRYGFELLERLPEPTILVHLHRALIARGYLKEFIDMFLFFERLLTKRFCADKVVPNQQSASYLLLSLMGRKEPEKLVARARQAGIKPLPHNTELGNTSYLMLMFKAGWDPDRIPDGDLPMLSWLCGVRLFRAQHTFDPVTGQKRLEDTGVVNRFRAFGYADNLVTAAQELLESVNCRRGQNPDPLKQLMDQEMRDKGRPKIDLRGHPSMRGMRDLTTRNFLQLLKKDIRTDICGAEPPLSGRELNHLSVGEVPFSGINHVGVLAHFMDIFEQIERELSERRNPLYIEVYEKDLGIGKEHKRAGLAVRALAPAALGGREDEECLRVMAQAL